MPQSQDTDFPTLTEIFSADKMKRVFSDFEEREEQLIMAQAVETALLDQNILTVEAGTGVGKSLSYLIPAVIYSIQTGKKVIVSTETIALQSQLIKKDLPIVSKILGIPIKAEIALGASNYVCKRKFKHVTGIGSFGIEMTDHLNDFYEWEKSTLTGIKSEYKGYASSDFWRKITRESDNCLGRKCPNYISSFYFLEKEKWKQSQILIVNHYLLSSHVAGDFKLLPDFGVLIVDEAHNFPDIVGKSFAKETSYQDLDNLILYTAGKDKKPGLLHKIQEITFRQKVDKLIKKAETLNYDFYQKLISELPLTFQETRITSNLKIDGGDLENILDKISASLIEYKESLNPETDDVTEKELSLELDMVAKRLLEHSEVINLFRTSSSNEIIRWIEPPPYESKDRFYILHIQPLHASEIIKNKLLPKLDTAIFTSATLSTGKKNFSFFLDEMGKPEGKEISLPSPFPYNKNALLYLPKNLRDPGLDSDGYHEDLCKLIPILLSLTNGNTFVLFTSNKSLKTVYEGIKDEIEYPIFSQSEFGSDIAKEKFLETNNSVLFGVSTFWQGIDIKGDKLRSVIITRIPFQPPGEPVLEAKIEEIKKNNGNAFGQIQLPKAILTLKQGFGRLIRSSTDKGIVSILDPRILSKSYGKQILDALPPAKRVLSFQELKTNYSKFFK